MPTPPASQAVSMLLEGQEDEHDAAAWQLEPLPPSVRLVPGKKQPKRKSQSTFSTVLATLLVGVFMFILGAFVGALLFQLLFNDSDFLSSSTALFRGPAIRSPTNESLIGIEEEEKEEDSNEDEYGEANPADSCPDFPWKHHRLPTDVVPTSYNLSIHPNITRNHLKGDVDIDIKVLNETNLIIIHAHRLNLSNYYIRASGKRIKSEFMECAESSMWAFQLSKPISPDQEIALGIEYEGEVQPDLQGLYITSHTPANSTQKWQSAITQFEPAHARRMLPCFDEPSLKATFELSVVRERHQTARSNMQLRVSREDVDGLFLDTFHRSVRMSTYLVALAILDGYDYEAETTTKTKRPIEVRLYAPSDVLRGQTAFSLDVAVRALEFFEGYFNISYPLEKQDLIALDDFSEGAMENWGLVTFRDTALLLNEKTGSVQLMEQIALIICHEIAHQWFGNLVTMEWWSDLWLNEGFANFMEYKCVDHLFPTWNIMTRLYAENVALSMELDGQRSTRPVSSVFAANTSHIMSLFDAISYHKAAAVIHMISELVGPDNFRRALIEYLNEFAYENARGEQLWEIVERHSSLPEGVTVQGLAKAFTTQVGYPVVRVGLDAAGERIVVYNQTRFLFDARGSSSDDDSSENSESKEEGGEEKEEEREEEEEDVLEWPLPIQFRTEHSNETTLRWLLTNQHKLSWQLSQPSKWIIANTEGIGYFKVLYDRKIYAEITRELRENHTSVSAIDRAMILADAFDFAKVGLIDIDVYMQLAEYATNEQDRMAWQLLNKHLRMMETLIEETPFATLFKDFERSLIVRLYERLKWTASGDFSESERGLRAEVLAMACRLRYGDCMRNAGTKLQQWLRNKKKVTTDLHAIVLESGVRAGDEAIWEKALTAFHESSNAMERQHLLAGLAATTEPALVMRLLHLCITWSIRPNQVPRVMAALASNPLARPLAWRFFRDHYGDFVKTLGDGSNLLWNTLRPIGERVSSRRDSAEVKTFLQDKNFGKSRVKQLQEQMRLNTQWRELNEKKLGAWLGEWDERRRRVHRGRKHTEKKTAESS